MRILVEHPHEGVARHAVQVVVVFLDVLAVVAFLVGQAEEPLLEERVAAVPEGERQAEVLKAVAEAGESVLVPAIGAAAGVVVGEMVPGVAVGAVVFADSAPGPLGEIGPPVLPVGAAGRAVAQAAVLGGRVFRHGHEFLTGRCGDSVGDNRFPMPISRVGPESPATCRVRNLESGILESVIPR